MEKSFIERLTDEQVVAFLERTYADRGTYSYEFSRDKFQIYVYTTDRRFSFGLFEYDAKGCSRSRSLWIKYLYEVFGEEYKQAYLDYCAEIFN